MVTTAILGATGLLGRALAPRLLRETSDRLVLLGRRDDALRAMARDLSSQHGEARVESRLADASRVEELVEGLRGCDRVVLALDGARHLRTVAEAALAARVSCIDPLIVPGRLALWRELTERHRERGCWVVTEAGLQPGLPGVLARAALEAMPDARALDVRAVLKIRIPPDLAMPSSMLDLVAAFTETPKIYGGGRAHVAWSALLVPYRVARFSPPFGRYALAVSALPELEALALCHPEIERLRFLVGGFNPVVNGLVLPLLLPLLWVPRRVFHPLVARVLFESLKRFTRPPFGAALAVDARSAAGARWSLELQHDDEYGLTCDALVALLEHVSRVPPAPGMHLMSELPPPRAFLDRLARLGARLSPTG
ncbi:MAG: saccharopine dehydrogenase NADP-binding domain-containing protein [Sandaracinaceae bacterium]|nr:saccharopine dehydrogenase NADP-binding domain-containing protein [Sandaracinaceae bacterium]